MEVLGAAWFNHPMWANVDYPSKRYEKGQKKLDIEWDLMELGPLDVPDDTAIAVYTSHTIEHVAEQAAVNLFEEALRVLRRGGFFRVTTNDSEVYLRAYQKGDAHCYQIRGIQNFRCTKRS